MSLLPVISEEAASDEQCKEIVFRPPEMEVAETLAG
jgi:hypothetical protein